VENIVKLEYSLKDLYCAVVHIHSAHSFFLLFVIGTGKL